MHELAVCQALLQQVTEVTHANSATCVSRITVLLGPLSGVEAPLLARAFSIARLGTVAATAELDIECEPVVIACNRCNLESPAAVNDFRCPRCGDVGQLVRGDALTLASIAIEREGALHV